MASSTLPLTISGVESNQGGMRLKFLVCPPPTPKPFSVFPNLIVTNVADESGTSLAYLITSVCFHVRTTKLTGTFIVRGEGGGGQRLKG